ncbi:SDR family oxidoreductase [Celeribacter arenosi]|uniref:SDR family oxidoreductase n=1 Tax=Celeribacter arenosi TaxID=792649 RepID=A0ABP7K0G3_9RHOB
MEAGIALVTGAGKRLGREMALYLAQRGFDVGVHFAHSFEGAHEVVDDIQNLGRNAVAIKADLLREEEAQALVGETAGLLGGPVTLLVNNASIFEADDLADMTRLSWDRHIESNLRAPVVLSQSFARQAPKAVPDAQGEPRARALIVNMLDQRVKSLRPEFLSYSIAKMGLYAFTEWAALALAPDVRVNAIGPGPTLRGAHQSSDEFAQERAATLLRRGVEPSDITATLGYFMDADGVTGQLICPDGGQHLS